MKENDNYLKNAEMDEEVSYNFIDGILGNAPERDPERSVEDFGLRKCYFGSRGEGISQSGAEIWLEYPIFNSDEATAICKRYLGMQKFNPDPDEQKFCMESFTALRAGSTEPIRFGSLSEQQQNYIRMELIRNIAARNVPEADQMTPKPSVKNDLKNIKRMIDVINPPGKKMKIDPER